ncbi:MAG: tRNA dihydrouridine synthase [Ruminococcus sp.]|jgi:tRNA-dihydrouridine synthase
MEEQFYFAPMEGITGYIYRNAQSRHFKKADWYVAPFIVSNQKGVLKSRDKNDILPEHNTEVSLIPQILSGRAEEFLLMAKKIREFGYQEINLNLGCPSQTVTAKRKGAGFLLYPEELDRFLDEVFSKLDMRISVKTRLGWERPEEFYELIKIFNRYPLAKLMIHPRVRMDFYKNRPNWEVFGEGMAMSRNPVCYNGDLFTAEDVKKFREHFPEVHHLMIGRGLLRDPALLEKLEDEKEETDKERYHEFIRDVCEGYRQVMSGDKNVLFKMKELWGYMIELFPGKEKCGKKIRKARSLSEYEQIVDELFVSI